MTFTSPDDQTTCGSSFGSNAITSVKSAGRRETRVVLERRSATSAAMEESRRHMPLENFRQLLVTPRTDV